jgi:hypothetical protein
LKPVDAIQELVEASGEQIDKRSFDRAKAVLAEEVPIKYSRKVRVERWAGPMGPVVGPSLIIADIQKVAEGLSISGFMKPWVVSKIKEHLQSGGVFTNRGQTIHDNEEPIVPNGQQVSIQARSEYRLATESEVLAYVDTSEFATVTGHKVSKRAQENQYMLHVHEGRKLIEAYDNLPKQAQISLDLMSEADREVLSDASIEVILANGIEAGRLKTKQTAKLIFGFYKKRLIEEGHLEEV